MKRLIRVLLLIFVVGTLIYSGGGLKEFFRPSTVRAFGDLTVDFHVPVGDPIFVVNNMAPGDMEDRDVDVANGGAVARFVVVKGIRTGGVGADPKIETVLDIVITADGIPVYGAGSPTGIKTLSHFFTDSQNPNGVPLGILNPSESKTYNFKVTFPQNAGNEFQGKSVIFDLTFGVIAGENIVINEVYYKVDSNHGLESVKDRINSEKGKKTGQNDEWIELYNPTDHDISLKNWTLTDNTNKPTIIHPNKIIKKGGFALVAKDASMWKFWNEDSNALKVETGNQIGDGLDNNGDHLILKNSSGIEVDRMSWGTDTSGFTPPAVNPVVSLGSSTERLVPGFDTNQALDWESQTPPTPGI